mmetsp:Transcript_16510/g.25643  ORF Transcript_16510/g.25643 Transcript_16510/m.25643 type:complete len:122 (+) Transcript_16510:1388-1753(+)
MPTALQSGLRQCGGDDVGAMLNYEFNSIHTFDYRMLTLRKPVSLSFWKGYEWTLKQNPSWHLHFYRSLLTAMLPALLPVEILFCSEPETPSEWKCRYRGFGGLYGGAPPIATPVIHSLPQL